MRRSHQPFRPAHAAAPVGLISAFVRFQQRLPAIARDAAVAAKAAVFALAAQQAIEENPVRQPEPGTLARFFKQILRQHQRIHHAAGFRPLGPPKPIVIGKVHRLRACAIGREALAHQREQAFVPAQAIGAQRAAQRRERSVRLHAHFLRIDARKQAQHGVQRVLCARVLRKRIVRAQAIQRDERASNVRGQMPAILYARLQLAAGLARIRAHAL